MGFNSAFKGLNTRLILRVDWIIICFKTLFDFLVSKNINPASNVCNINVIPKRCVLTTSLHRFLLPSPEVKYVHPVDKDEASLGTLRRNTVGARWK